LDPGGVIFAAKGRVTGWGVNAFILSRR
jgi:hypothetical protein